MRQQAELALIGILVAVILTAGIVVYSRGSEPQISSTVPFKSSNGQEPPPATEVLTPSVTSTVEVEGASTPMSTALSQITRPGEVILAPALEYITDITLIGAVELPTNPIDSVLESMRETGITVPSMQGVTLTNADYGIGTWGRWVVGGDGSREWVGPIELQLDNGEVPDRFEDRPAWLLTFDVRATESPTGASQQSYFIDDATGSVLFVATIEDPILPPPIDATILPESQTP